VVQADQWKDEMFGDYFRRQFMTQESCLPSPFKCLALNFESKILPHGPPGESTVKGLQMENEQNSGIQLLGRKTPQSHLSCELLLEVVEFALSMRPQWALT
jgi:hypothetical protein